MQRLKLHAPVVSWLFYHTCQPPEYTNLETSRYLQGHKQASEGRGIEAKFEASLEGGEGGKRGTVHCLIPLCPPPHSPCGFAVAQNFTKRNPTITPAT